MITGAAKVAGVVGWPVKHSLSPLIHNAWIEALGLDAVYVPFAVPPDALDGFLAAASGGWLEGLNVTVPYKRLVARQEWARTDEARAIDAGNLLLFTGDGQVVVDSTDARGVLTAFAEQGSGWMGPAGPVAILGAGGAASAAISAMQQAGSPEVRVVARRLTAARQAAFNWDAFARAFDFDQLDQALEGVTAVINATSAGLNGIGELPAMDAAPPGAVFMDMVYSPLRTKFLEGAAARGHATVDGLSMLIGQARPSFEAFFGVPPPPPEIVDVRALCLRALGEG